ncbi:MAG: hypothetical protein A3C50_00810 [Candidatus Staskawiczbacteria bacterium RIFCSPHIGHO2_02_FULL_43_16]|uniref:Uncharacterized protein n=1 Tax=Candidatus Staskawiczbacteria bacterium RIFCSPHIGHO2_01_FULL_41_41 TaxID=1802203 RepID=A0A1G2HUG3_9BACT|nr:MAG: hypothetical protein A2822_00080 [Candidatus Staskawiczbacteria bacterium RIFCSPHIGHO2_01_FULL_41_41]OGZ68295.1 MAG: hypothetical protein A3C50_00810 [Candidatus Staskawiczbacteria bacterium RIFCSPHIGHO2_02_FULL_43_16]OGZ74684.1 MAG: hypothetical protein A3A12_00900 [Candidatus Staskawiczbacteria bacterium RIFCSPLOWO2_01_FULL_43_17b]
MGGTGVGDWFCCARQLSFVQLAIDFHDKGLYIMKIVPIARRDNARLRKCFTQETGSLHKTNFCLNFFVKK